LEKYLRTYAEPEIAALDDLPGQPDWENVMVIPACNESPAFLRLSPPCGGRSLMVLVINEAVAAPLEVSQRNLALASAVQERFEPVWRSAPGTGLSLWRDPQAQRDLLLADRFSDGRQLPERGGVGFARKLGADLALSLIDRRRIRSSWIHCTDADVQLPGTYFTCSNELGERCSKYSALLYPFHHCDDRDRVESGEVLLATLLYELSLRYYVAGLKSACSPYAFHTIGSTMAVNAVHYAQVRGFPKREAGEDFYLLNKLAKVGPVLELAAGSGCGAIEIESRRSDRVPFGTGAAVNRITAMADPASDFEFYNPAVFRLLQHWLRSLPEVWQSGSASLAAGLFSGLADNRGEANHAEALLTGLKMIMTENALEHAFRQSKNLDQFTRQVHTWFDAFRTLKLIHALRDLSLPSIKYAALYASSQFHELLASEPDLLAFHELLRKNPAAEAIRGQNRSVTSPATIN
jgi:hypothetical protein